MYLSENIFTWSFDQQAQRSPLNKDGITRAREIWSHARNRLTNNPSELDRTDCMTSLKRATNHRLKALEAEYAISTLPASQSNKKTLENLQEYGLVRPTLLTELMKVRNDIEHNERPPPDLNCHLYVDIVWYFLKSTDQLLDMVVDEIAYEDVKTNSALTLKFHTSGTWKVKVEGIVRPEFLSDLSSDFKLEVINFLILSKNRNESVRFNGTINLAPDIHLQLACDYFGVQGYDREDRKS